MNNRQRSCCVYCFCALPALHLHFILLILSFHSISSQHRSPSDTTSHWQDWSFDFLHSICCTSLQTASAQLAYRVHALLSPSALYTIPLMCPRSRSMKIRLSLSPNDTTRCFLRLVSCVALRVCLCLCLCHPSWPSSSSFAYLTSICFWASYYFRHLLQYTTPWLPFFVESTCFHFNSAPSWRDETGHASWHLHAMTAVSELFIHHPFILMDLSLVTSHFPIRLGLTSVDLGSVLRVSWSCHSDVCYFCACYILLWLWHVYLYYLMTTYLLLLTYKVRIIDLINSSLLHSFTSYLTFLLEPAWSFACMNRI